MVAEAVSSGAIWARTPLALYGAGDEERLVEDLEQVAAHTLVVDVSEPGDVEADYRGLVREELRYTLAGLKQILSATCPGAYLTVTELAGARPEHGEADRVAAVDVFNRILAARFDRLAGNYRLIHDHGAGTIDGVLGPKFILYANSDFLGHVRASLDRGEGLVFESASLQGRRLVARYRRPEPVAELELDGRVESFYQGWHVTNSEAGGEAAIFLAATLVRAGAGAGAAMKGIDGCWVRHAGKSFQDKLRRALAKAGSFSFNPDALAAQLRRLDATPMFDGGEAATAETVGAASRRYTAAIQRAGATARVARRIVLAAITGQPLDPMEAPRPARRRPTRYHLFLSLMECGVTLPHRSRDAAERSAFLLLEDRLV